VQILWRTGHAQKSFPAIRPLRRVGGMWTSASRPPSLDLDRRLRRITALSFPHRKRGVTVHRFEETIGGRTYYIEVTPVSNRWRAQILRIPGMPTALMPFYGQTPDEAARQLSQWLLLANRRQAMTAAHGAARTSTV
jgi:hypothetical protein